MGEPEVFGMWYGWEMLEDEEDVVRCSVCGKRVPEDKAVHCRRCGAALCPGCEMDGMCPTCEQRVDPGDSVENRFNIFSS